MKKEFRKKLPAIIITVVGTALIVLIGWFCIYFYSCIAEEQNVRYYCIGSARDFDNISSYFRALSGGGLIRASYSDDKSGAELLFRSFDENGESVFTEDTADCADEDFVSSLASLREKYQPENEYPVFSYIDAYYDDNGNMLLYVRARTKPAKEEDKITAFYLVYIDEGYEGNGSPLGIDKFGGIREPFSGSWCFWVEDAYIR